VETGFIALITVDVFALVRKVRAASCSMDRTCTVVCNLVAQPAACSDVPTHGPGAVVPPMEHFSPLV